MPVYHIGSLEIEVDSCPLKRLAGVTVLCFSIWLILSFYLPQLPTLLRAHAAVSADLNPAKPSGKKYAPHTRLEPILPPSSIPVSPIPTPLSSLPVALTVNPAHLLTLTGTWQTGEVTSAQKAVIDLALRLAETLYQTPDLLALTGPVSPEQAFLLVYRGPVEFRRVAQTCATSRAARGLAQACGDEIWGETLDRNLVLVFADASPTDLITHPRWFVHELGHAFSHATGQQAETDMPSTLGRDTLFAGPLNTWQFSASPAPNEIFADLFLAWVYTTWGGNPAGPAFMQTHLTAWLISAIPPP